MVISREELLKRGWSEDEINYTFNVIDKADKQKSSFIHFLDGVISWFGLILVFIGSLILSVILMPFFVTVSGFFLYFMISFLALVLGLVFNFLLTQINDVGNEEKVLGEFFLPVIGIIDVYVMIGISNVLENVLQMDNYNPPNSLLYGIIYVISLCMPFFISHQKKLKEKYLKSFSKFFSNSKNVSDVSYGVNNPGNNYNNMVNNSTFVPNQSNFNANSISQNQNNSNSNFGSNNTVNNSQNPDFYDEYMRQLREKEARKALYQDKLKKNLMKRLGK